VAELTARQVEILKAIIEEFISGAQPVGSEELTEKRQFAFSPATVRNEMAVLHQEGFIEKEHSSAGRKPSELGLRYYLTTLMQEQALPVLQEVALKQRLFQYRQSSGRMLREASLALAESAGYIGIVTTHEGTVFHAGTKNVLEHPEFFDINVTRAALNLLDSYDLLQDLFSRASDPKAVTVLIGRELGVANLEPVGMVFAHWGNGQKGGVVAVLGPARLNYAVVVPQVRHLSQLLTELAPSF
jgi:heat-inducible transcriptional repressor